MNRLFKLISIITLLALTVCMITACDSPDDVISESKCEIYLVNDDGTEELITYNITTIQRNGSYTAQSFSPDGVLWMTMENAEITSTTDAYTAEISAEQEKLLAGIGLLGTNSEDLVYEDVKNDDGVVTEERYSSKSGSFPTLHLKYTYKNLD